MVLAFRLKDYELIRETASETVKDIKDLIVEACKQIGRDPNFYSNPDNIEDYQEVEIINLKITHDEFMLILNKANFHNYSIEVFVAEAVRMYRSLYSEVLEPELVLSSC